MATPANGPATGIDAPLYVQIAEHLTQQVVRGVLRPGDRVPSLRRLSRQQRVSVSTALQAYMWLENRGYLEARPQSGFFIRTPFSSLIPEPQAEPPRVETPSSTEDTVLADVVHSAADPSYVPFGAGSASPELYPNRRLNLIARHIIKHQPHHSALYDFPPGFEPLRRQIARRALDMGCVISARDVVTTCGGMEAINLALRAVAKPGDVIAMESPSYFGAIGAAISLGLKVIEICTHPQEGMDLDDLERAIRKHRVKACLAMTNCHNPLGYVLSDRHKRALVELTARHNVALVEDDVYGDLSFQGPRPRALKSYDRKGQVLFCGSFSKILSPGLRLGWILPGRYSAEVERLKLLSTISAPTLAQQVVGEFMESGGYDRHLKRLRSTLASQVEGVRGAIAQYFPSGTRISRPAGGYMLWVELPSKVNAVKLHRAALAEHITVIPGPVFSVSGKFRNYIRINCGHRWSDAHDRALMTLGRLCDRS